MGLKQENVPVLDLDHLWPLENFHLRIYNIASPNLAERSQPDMNISSESQNINMYFPSVWDSLSWVLMTVLWCAILY